MPAVLTLEADGTLVLMDNDGQVFSTPLSLVKAKFSAWGTMTLVAGGKKYDFVGTPAPLSPPISAQLNAEMNQTEQDAAKRNQGIVTGGGVMTAGGVGVSVAGRALGAAGASVAGATSTIAGAAMMQYAYISGLKGIKRWESTFITAGLVVKKRSMRAMLYFFLGIVFVFVAIIVIGALSR